MIRVYKVSEDVICILHTDRVVVFSKKTLSIRHKLEFAQTAELLDHQLVICSTNIKFSLQSNGALVCGSILASVRTLLREKCPFCLASNWVVEPLPCTVCPVSIDSQSRFVECFTITSNKFFVFDRRVDTILRRGTSLWACFSVLEFQLISSGTRLCLEATRNFRAILGAKI